VNFAGEKGMLKQHNATFMSFNRRFSELVRASGLQGRSWPQDFQLEHFEGGCAIPLHLSLAMALANGICSNWISDSHTNIVALPEDSRNATLNDWFIISWPLTLSPCFRSRLFEISGAPRHGGAPTSSSRFSTRRIIVGVFDVAVFSTSEGGFDPL